MTERSQCGEWSRSGGRPLRCVLDVAHGGDNNFGGVGPHMSAEAPEITELREAVGPGGRLEFIHAGGTIDVPSPVIGMEASLRGAILMATAFPRPTLFRYTDDEGQVREGVLISRERYLQLVRAERAGSGDA
jgi:hypothetical protein